ncbi:MAG: tRNA (adenosine(37)-N6)-threonylcarbamoyltransferase complex dimerization subunit type 1 TsaB, partial [Gammaproteobacteria bacterium]|nr:tRNA (adenosine(37)-N6)-threonylcarbamoyltransferase complex dimerization subunit type 1 TsaB [Gammaproteobacteria bacterium]
MKLLAIDTSTEACSVALQVGSERLHLDEVCPQQHSKRVLPMVQQLLTQAGLSLQQLDGIVFGRGPGSFTGVRIGVGVTQG